MNRQKEILRSISVCSFILFLVSSVLTSCIDKNLDAEIPFITLVGEPSLQLSVGDSFEDPGFIAIDNLDGDISGRVIIDYSTIDITTAGVYQLEYNVIDSSGNIAATVIRTVVIVESYNPVLTINGDNVVFCDINGTYEDPGCTAVDFRNNNISERVISDFDTVIDLSKEGAYFITYTVFDSIGGRSSVVRTVYVLYPDTPLIILQGDGLNEASPYLFQHNDPSYAKKEPGYNAYCRSIGDITHLVKVNYLYSVEATAYDQSLVDGINSTIPDYEKLFMVEYNVVINEGMPSEASSVTYRFCKLAEDTTAPVLTLLGDNPLYLEVDQDVDTYVEQGVSIIDNMINNGMTTTELFEAGLDDGSGASGLTLEIDSGLFDSTHINKEHLDENLRGGYPISYVAIDAAGNRSQEIFRTVIVRDTIKPFIAVPDISVDYASLYQPAPIVTDNSGEGIIANIVSGWENGNERTVGDYSVKFSAIDLSGNYITTDAIVSVSEPAALLVNGGFESRNINGLLYSGALNTNTYLDATGWKWQMTGKLRDSYLGGPDWHDIVCSNNGNIYGAAPWASGPYGLDHAFSWIRHDAPNIHSGEQYAFLRNSFTTNNNTGLYQDEIYYVFGTLSQTVQVHRNVRYKVTAYLKTNVYGGHKLDSFGVRGQGSMRLDRDGQGLDAGDTDEFMVVNTADDGSVYQMIEVEFTPNIDGDFDVVFQRASNGTDEYGWSCWDDASVEIVWRPTISQPTYPVD